MMKVYQNLTFLVCLIVISCDFSSRSSKNSNKEAPLKFTSGKAIYGPDDRREVYQLSNEFFKEAARSTAAQISKDYLTRSSSSSYSLYIETLNQDGWCKEEKFSSQPAVANCSGFLVGSNILVTAGHCVETIDDCHDYYWVFDYTQGRTGKPKKSFRKDKVYRCKKVLSQEYDRDGTQDFALIQLDREVEGRIPLKFRTDGEIPLQAPLVVIGHPNGLPAKVAGNAHVRGNNHPDYFETNLDTFKGNSGSAVFNARTGVIEGILVRGEVDFYMSSNKCKKVRKCSNSKCRGEDVTRITQIQKLMDMYENGDFYYERQYWENHYGPGKNYALYDDSSRGEVPQVDYSDSNSYELMDFGISRYSFNVKEDLVINNFRIKLFIDHPYSEDYSLTLVGPDLYRYQIKDFGQVLSKSGHLVLSSKGHPRLRELKGTHSKGRWSLEINDRVGGDEAFLKKIEVNITGS